ncbi:TetR/AcrR family transcriptional regulator [Kineosporia sp. A_224]|uniref:TetR/AcrR family transcriptional regulator n=1 Tax=Kineosporia sp. A_224 TaxID=1962180 RepID=UPI00117AED9B|nr:TetR/AcrR family transcriptional regulator [Kineosporia sp. A_224]
MTTSLSETAGAVLVRRRDALANRIALLDAGLAALTRDPDASLESVARAAGLSRRTVYGHFSSREELVAAIATRAGDRLVSALDAVDTSADDPATALARFELAVWRAAEPFRFLGALAARSEHRDRALERLDPLRRRRAALVRTGQDEGVFRGDTEAEVLARVAGQVVLAVLEEVLEGTVDVAAAGRLVATSALAVVGVAPAKAARCADAAADAGA